MPFSRIVWITPTATNAPHQCRTRSVSYMCVNKLGVAQPTRKDIHISSVPMKTFSKGKEHCISSPHIMSGRSGDTLMHDVIIAIAQARHHHTYTPRQTREPTPSDAWKHAHAAYPLCPCAGMIYINRWNSVARMDTAHHRHMPNIALRMYAEKRKNVFGITE